MRIIIFVILISFLISCAGEKGEKDITDIEDGEEEFFELPYEFPEKDLIEEKTDLFKEIEIDLPKTFGEFGDPCKSNEDCQSGFCVEGYEGYICTILCQTECPSGYVCIGVSINPPDITFLCLPLVSKLCQSCKNDIQCSGGKCVSMEGKNFCLTPCKVDSECPKSYLCKDDLCTPKSASCECSPESVGLERSCKKVYETNVCYGVEICGEDGWGECLLPDEVCDGKDNNCNGKIDEGFYNPQKGKYDTDIACGICGNNCTVLKFSNAKGVCNAEKFVPDCKMECLSGFFDVNKNPNDGCECKFLSSTDKPNGFDENCDGIDGEVKNGVFVAKNGKDTNEGSIDSPVRTIQKGINIASEKKLRDVYVATGVYVESLELSGGVYVYGGYSSNFLIRDIVLYETVIFGTEPTKEKPAAVNAKSIPLNNGATLDGFTIFGFNNKKKGGSSYAVYIQDCTSSLSVRNNYIIAGDGGNGMRGQDGDDGENGVPGTNGKGAKDIGNEKCNSSHHNAGGIGGKKVCDGIDVSGGDGGNAICPDYDEDGAQPKSSPYKQTQKPEEFGKNGNGYGGGKGGSPGYDAIIWYGPGSECGICNPPRKKDGDPFLPQGGEYGKDGENGKNGKGGGGCKNSQGKVIDGLWFGDKGENGNNGQGGGGGGGGGAAGGVETIGCTQYKFAKFPDIGGSGGGGGSGGCGGKFGTGGESGGGSFGIFLIFSKQPELVPFLENNIIETGNAGLGGDGGNGGVGGLGGDGKPGGPSGDGTVDAWCADLGGRGGQGGNGGHGGGGGGGCGGVSYGIFASGQGFINLSGYKSPANSFILKAKTAAGGSGGSSLGEKGGKGADGIVAETNF